MRLTHSAYCLTAMLAVMFLAGSPALAQSVTGYREMMKDVFDPVCLGCHNSTLTGTARNGAPASVNFDTYTLAVVNANLGNTRAQAGTMPPSGPLSDTAKGTFQAWVTAGTPLGTVVDYQDMREQVFVPVCMNCHDSGKSGSTRNGAPSTVNFDTYAAAKTNAVQGNARAQAGTMPPTGPLSATRKAYFQDWVWLDTPSGDFVSYATLTDSLFTSTKCLLCHSSTASNRLGAPTGVDYDTYIATAVVAARTNNRVQTATTSPHGPQSQSIKDLIFNWIYAGTPENDPSSGPVCDLDSSGVVETADVIWLILYYRDHAFDNLYDFNSDGKYSLGDAVTLILNIRDGVCSDAGSLLASVGGYVVPEWLSELSADDVAYVESFLDLLGLSPDEATAIRQALHGQNGAPALPRAFSLGQNSPNPFNPLTTISYTVPEGAAVRVRIEVFDTGGRLIATLSDQYKDAGSYSVFWDGSDNSGQQVASGVYFYRMSAGQFSQMRKMVLLK